MSTITINDGLPFITVTLRVNGQALTLQRVLVDTGSAASIFKTDELAKLGIIPRPEDPIRTMTGVGGKEFIIQKQISGIEVGDLKTGPFIIQMGALDYDIPIEGILGTDFLLAVEAVIDFAAMQIRGTSGTNR